MRSVAGGMNTSQMDSYLMTSHKADSQIGELQKQEQPFKLPAYLDQANFKSFLATAKSEL